MKENVEKTLVLCIDRDNDLGQKTGIKTPLLGRNENLRAALNLALKDPEEADANAMFEAVRIYDRLKSETTSDEEPQIATITGLDVIGVKADRKIISELTSVLNQFPATGVVLVTDGFTDEAVLPLIQSRIPVNSVRRIVVKHSESIEETAAVFSRYVKTIMENPRYSRLALGLPGILIIVFAVLLSLGLTHLAWASILIIIGVAFFIIGFGFEDRVLGLYSRTRNRIKGYSPPSLTKQVVGFSSTAGFLLIGIGCFQAGSFVINYISNLPTPPTAVNEWFSLLPGLIGRFISGAIILIVVGILILLLGVAIRYVLERDSRFWGVIVVMVVSAWSQQILSETSRILIKPETSYLQLLYSIIIGIFLTGLTVFVAFKLRKRYAFFFNKEEEVEEIKKD